jgi:hypothetical protein
MDPKNERRTDMIKCHGCQKALSVEWVAILEEKRKSPMTLFVADYCKECSGDGDADSCIEEEYASAWEAGAEEPPWLFR